MKWKAVSDGGVPSVESRKKWADHFPNKPFVLYNRSVKTTNEQCEENTLSESNTEASEKNRLEDYLKDREVEGMFNVIDEEWGIELKNMSDSTDESEVAEDAGLWHYHLVEGKYTVDCIYVRNVPASFDGEDTYPSQVEDPPPQCPFCKTSLPEYVRDTYLAVITNLSLG
jgi:hypothetical protein